jgi:hypothetical protein
MVPPYPWPGRGHIVAKRASWELEITAFAASTHLPTQSRSKCEPSQSIRRDAVQLGGSNWEVGDS